MKHRTIRLDQNYALCNRRKWILHKDIQGHRYLSSFDSRTLALPLGHFMLSVSFLTSERVWVLHPKHLLLRRWHTSSSGTHSLMPGDARLASRPLYLRAFSSSSSSSSFLSLIFLLYRPPIHWFLATVSVLWLMYMTGPTHLLAFARNFGGG
jgi:hypothetical protein